MSDMAYGGKCDVTKSVVFYVKNHPYLSNAELDRDIRAKFGCTYADSTYERIRNGAYDAKFNLTNYSSGYEDDAIYGKTNVIQAAAPSIRAIQAAETNITVDVITDIKILCMIKK